MGVAMAPPPMAAVPMGSAAAVRPKPKPKKKTMGKKKAIKPKRKMKTLHWKPIADKKIIGTIWENVSKIEDEIVMEKAGNAFFAPKLEKKKEEKKKEGDEAPKRTLNTLEELFGAKPKKK